jgi:hypothetical protein
MRGGRGGGQVRGGGEGGYDGSGGRGGETGAGAGRAGLRGWGRAASRADLAGKSHAARAVTGSQRRKRRARSDAAWH